MTICIGALGCNLDGQPSRAVVVAADRMVTWHVTEFEHEVSKITEISDRAVALISGDAVRGARLARELKAGVPAGHTIQDAAEGAARLYGDLRRQQVESDILQPRGMSMAQFYQGMQQSMLPQISGLMDQQIVGFDFNLEFLVAGVDDDGAHLFTVMNPGGSAQNFDTIGFNAIGSGTLHATQAMIGFGHFGGAPLDETVFRVYAAKRRAEVAPGVGKATDMAVVLPDGPVRIKKSDLDQLETLYQQYQKPITEELREGLGRISLLDGRLNGQNGNERGTE